MSKIPEGQSKRGTPSAESRNPKSGTGLSSIGKRGDGTEHGQASTRVATRQNLGDKPNRSKKPGSASDLPDSSKLRGYITPGKSGSRSTTNTGARRQRFGIDPGRNKLG